MKGVFLSLLLLASVASADTLCVQKSVKASKTGVVNLSKAVRKVLGDGTCPKGYSVVGSVAPHVSSCGWQSTSVASDPTSGVAATILYCPDGTYMTHWDFDYSGNYTALLNQAIIKTSTDNRTPMGINVKTFPEAEAMPYGKGTYTLILNVFCCPF